MYKHEEKGILSCQLQQTSTADLFPHGFQHKQKDWWGKVKLGPLVWCRLWVWWFDMV